MDLKEIAEEIKAKGNNEKITLIYAFNGVGKTQLSVEYKNITKKALNIQGFTIMRIARIYFNGIMIQKTKTQALD